MKKNLLEPVKKIRLYESIVKQIQGLISNGQLKPGERLPSERELTNQLGVSRTSIREALRALEMMGYLESRVGIGGGTYIKEMTLDSVISPFSETLLQNDEFIVELLELRLILEIGAVRLVAIRRTDQHLKDLSSAISDMSSELENGGTGLEADNQFHTVLAAAADNRVLGQVVRMCGHLLEVEREEHLRSDKKARTKALKEHRGLYEAIRKRDEDGAEHIMRNHLVNISTVIKSKRAKQKSTSV